jgi:hypothetical protein
MSRKDLAYGPIDRKLNETRPGNATGRILRLPPRENVSSASRNEFGRSVASANGVMSHGTVNEFVTLIKKAVVALVRDCPFKGYDTDKTLY